VIDDDAKDIVMECMWTPGNATETSPSPAGHGDGEGEGEGDEASDEKIKIAWRYGHLKKFQTTVSSSSSSYVTYFYKILILELTPHFDSQGQPMIIAARLT
jgi:hypothetical protein